MIPRIIHQIWDSGRNTIPLAQQNMAETWKTNHPTWQYEYWDKERIEAFIHKYFPHLLDLYFGYKHNVQRWDVIRYLILFKIGGVYVDFDYECIEPLDDYLSDKRCCFALDPTEHARIFNKEYIVTNAFIATEPNHPFLREVIENLEVYKDSSGEDIFENVLNTTGPYYITALYEKWTDKSDVTLVPANIVSPLSKNEIANYVNGLISDEEIEAKLKDAIAVHYFDGSWYRKQNA